MEPGNSSAEKELLKAIEGKVDLSKKIVPPAAALKQMPELGNLLGDLKKRMAEILPKTFKADIFFFNKILFIVITLLVAFYGVTFLKGLHRLGRMPHIEPNPIAVQHGSGKSSAPTLKDYSYYIDTLTGRNIFNSVEQKKSEPIATSKIAEMSKNIRVAGISWAEDVKERYAMIEDTSAKVTYFMQEGDRVSSFLIKNIYKDHVTLGYMEETIDIR